LRSATPNSAITLPEKLSFGRQRNSQRLPMWVRVGSVPPIIIGLPILSTSGAMACTWVLRMEPMKAGMSGCEARRLKASTAPILGCP